MSKTEPEAQVLNNCAFTKIENSLIKKLRVKLYSNFLKVKNEFCRISFKKKSFRTFLKQKLFKVDLISFDST